MRGKGVTCAAGTLGEIESCNEGKKKKKTK